MGTFNTKKVLNASPSLIPAMADAISTQFSADGFEVMSTPLSNGGCDISITKGGMFKAVVGLKTALKVSLNPSGSQVYFEAGVGIWGQQAIPTIISMLFFWPVLLTQIWGLIDQSELDDKALAAAESVIDGGESTHSADNNLTPSGQAKGKFCTNCGSILTGAPKFCPECGHKL